MAGKPLQPGAYIRRITIQQEAPVAADAFGTALPTWTTVVQTWAALVPKTWQAATMDGQIMIRRQASYRLRRLPSTPIRVGMRVIDTTEADATQTWVIVDVQDIDGNRRELLLICQYVLPDMGV